MFSFAGTAQEAGAGGRSGGGGGGAAGIRVHGSLMPRVLFFMYVLYFRELLVPSS